MYCKQTINFIFDSIFVGANPLVENENGHTAADYAKLGSPIRELLDDALSDVSYVVFTSLFLSNLEIGCK